MDRFKRGENYFGLEIFLPLFLLSDEKMFYAAALFPFVAGTTLLLLEMMRAQSRSALFTFYLFWLAGCGALAWLYAAIPPYWIWSVYLLIPKSVWEPSDVLRKKPFFFGFKKYYKRRLLELATALSVSLVFAVCFVWLRMYFEGPVLWVLILFALLVLEIFLTALRRQNK